MDQSPYMILIVDDAEAIVSYLRQLETKGFVIVTEADTAEKALDCLKTNPQINLIILDYWLINSSLDGRQLAQRIRKHYPDKKIVFFTDHFSQGNKEEIKPFCEGVIPKCYTINEIANYINCHLITPSKPAFTEEEIALLCLLAIPLSNFEIARIEWENEKIEKFFDKKHEFITENSCRDDRSFSIETILYYFWQYGLEVRLFKEIAKKKVFHSEMPTKGNNRIAKYEDATIFRKAIRKLIKPNNENIPCQSEIPEIQHELFQKLDDWLASQLSGKDINCKKILDIDLFIRRFFIENQSSDWMQLSCCDTAHKEQEFVNHVRKLGYLNQYELKILQQTLDEEIIQQANTESDERKEKIKQNFIIDHYYCKNNKKRDTENGKSQAKILREKIRAKGYLYPYLGNDLVLKDLSKWIGERLPEVDELIREITKYFGQEKLTIRAKKELISDLPFFKPPTHFDAAETYTLYHSLHKDQDQDLDLVYQQPLKRINRRCSDLIKKLSGSGELPPNEPDGGYRPSLINYAARNFTWKTP